MKGIFLKNLSFLLLLNILIKPIWIFAIDRGVQNTVGSIAYGHYQALFNLSLIFQILLDFGLHTYSTQRISLNSKRLHHVFSNVMMGKLSLSIIYFVVVLGWGWAANMGAESISLLALLCFTQMLSSFTQYFRTTLSALHHYKLDATISVIDRTIMIIICGYLLYSSAYSAQFTIRWFVLAQIVAFSISSLLSLGLILYLKTSDLAWPNLNHTLRYIKKGLPYAILILLMSIYTRADVFILERLTLATDPSQAGKYAAAYRLLDVVNNVSGVLFASLLLPLFARLLHQHQELQQIVSLSKRILLPMALAVAIFFGFYGGAILQLLYHDVGMQQAPILALLMASFPFFCINYIYATLLTAAAKIRVLIVISAGAMVLSIVANMLLAATFGAMGIAAVCLMVQALVALCNVLGVRHFFRFQRDFGFVWRLLAFSALMTIASLLFRQWHMDLLTAIAAIALAAGGSYLLLGFVKPSEVGRLLGKTKS